MNYAFLLGEMPSASATPILISGEDSKDCYEREYLAVIYGKESLIFEIRYDTHCSPFKEVVVNDTTLAVGHEEHCYLFDLTKKEHLLTLPMEGYFGHIYSKEKIFYVSDACQLIAVTNRGQILWNSENLGIDGVVVKEVNNGKIYGEGEWDPPGGWIDFVLDAQTGKRI